MPASEELAAAGGIIEPDDLYSQKKEKTYAATTHRKGLTALVEPDSGDFSSQKRDLLTAKRKKTY